MKFALSSELYTYLPELFLLLSTLLILLFGVFFERLRPNSIGFISYCSALLGIVGLIFVFFLILNSVAFLVPTSFNFDYISLSGINFFLKLFLIFVTILFFLISLSTYSRDKFFSFEIVLLFLFSTLGYLILIDSRNLLTLYLALELSSFSLYVLAAVKKFNLFSTESGLKYFILGAFSSGLLLFGISSVYGFSGTIELNNLSVLLHSAAPIPSGLQFGLFLFLAGILFKLGVVPFHLWVPDVYDGAPTVITAYYAIVTKISIFAVLARFFYEVLGSLTSYVTPYTLLFAIASILLGTFGALAQRRIKRFIAYSGIVHSGYLLLGLSVGTTVGLLSALFYLFCYIILNLNFFSIILSVRRSSGLTKLKNLDDLAPLFRAEPLSAASLSLNLFSMAGIPPLIGFISKLYILFALIFSSFYFSAFFVILTSVISSVYYLRLVKIMYFEKPFKWSYTLPYPIFSSIVFSFSTLFNLIFILVHGWFFFFILGLQ